MMWQNWMRLVVLGLALASGRTGSASVIVMGDSASAQIQTNGNRNIGATMRLGASSSFTPALQGSRVVVFVFQLPSPGAGEQAVVVDADFQFTITTDRTDGAYNIDLYGLGLRESATVLSSDNYAGEFDDSDATLLQDNLIPAAHPNNGVEAVNHTSTALVDYLNDQYGLDGSGAGKYVFLRLNPDQVPGNENTGVDVALPGNSTAKPQLSVTFVPEPSVIILGGPLVSAWSLSRRPRRGRWRG